MQLRQESNNALYRITSYTANSVTVNDKVCTSAILLSNSLFQDWDIKDIQELNNAHLELLIAQTPDIIIIGTGQTLILPEPQKLSILYNAKIGLEIMSTPSACRTYSLISNDDRKVLAALII